MASREAGQASDGLEEMYRRSNTVWPVETSLNVFLGEQKVPSDQGIRKVGPVAQSVRAVDS